MMGIIFKSTKDLLKLHQVLKGRNDQTKLKSLVGALNASLAGHWTYEAIVDRWPDVTSVILRPNSDKSQVLPFKYSDVYVYSHNKLQFKELIENSDVLPKEYPYGIPVCPTELIDVIAQRVEKGGGHIERKGPVYYSVRLHNVTDLKEYFDERCDLARFTYGPVQEQDLEMIFSLWQSHRKTTKVYWLPLMKQMITINPSICAFDEEDKAVSWTLIHLDGCGMMAYTKPQYRNLGLLPAITIMLKHLSPENLTFAYAPKPTINKVHYAEALMDTEFQFLQCVNTELAIKSSKASKL